MDEAKGGGELGDIRRPRPQRQGDDVKGRRSSRSARKAPLAAIAGRSTLAAATIGHRPHHLRRRPAPNSPYSITRRICSWTRGEAVAISSETTSAIGPLEPAAMTECGRR